MQEVIGYRFENHSYLQKALTHSSYSNEQGDKHHHLLCNERLEFLGDSVLSVVVSRYLYTAYPDLAEGELTKLRAELVCERALSSFADRIHLGDYLKKRTAAESADPFWQMRLKPCLPRSISMRVSRDLIAWVSCFCP